MYRVNIRKDIKHPCRFNPLFSDFEACLSCTSAHEDRLCSGETLVSWRLCRAHRYLLQGRVSDEHGAFQDNKLPDETRDTGVSNTKNCDQETWGSHEDWKMYEMIAHGVHDGSMKRPEVKTVNKFGLNRTKHHAIRYDTNLSDDVTDHQLGHLAGRHVGSIPSGLYESRWATAMVDANKDYSRDTNATTTDDRCNNYDANMTRSKKSLKLEVLWPEIVCYYQHADGCVHSPNPSYYVNSSVHRQQQTNERLVFRVHEMHKKMRTDDKSAKHMDLREMAGDIYFKKCNGQFVNSFGSILDKNLNLNDQIRTLTLTNIKLQRPRSDVSGLNYNLIPQSAKTRTGTTTQEPTEESDEKTPAAAATLLCSNKGNNNLDDNSRNVIRTKSSTATSNYSQVHASTEHTPDQDPDKSIKPLRIPSALTHTINPNNPPIPLPRLLSREHLVDINAVPPADLILTCWAWNRMSESC